MKNILFGGEINFSFPRDLDGDLERREKVKILENLSWLHWIEQTFSSKFCFSRRKHDTHTYTHIYDRFWIGRKKERS